MEERCSTGTPLESPEPVGAHRGEQPSRGGVSTASSELQPEPSPCGHTSRCALQRTSVFTSCCVADACALSAPETRFSNPRSPSMETPHPEPQRTLRRAKAHLECPSSLRCRSQGPSQGSPNGSWQTNAPPRSQTLTARHQDELCLPVSAFVVDSFGTTRRLGDTSPLERTATALPHTVSDPTWVPHHARGFPLVSAGLPPASTCATLPHCGISTTWQTSPGTGHHSGRRSASPVSNRCRSHVHVARGCYSSKLRPYVQGSRPGIVSARIYADDFRVRI